VSIEHYENFPVASWLCPPALRAPITAIYHFARTADDIADEGPATAEERLADLTAYRTDLRSVVAGQAPSPRWSRKVFQPLAVALREHRLPAHLLEDLLDAFVQDLTKSSYADRPELLDYCRRSANPVGRLLLHLYGIEDPVAMARSDAICSALQLINFWQDFTIDGPRGRVYAPQTDLRRHGLQGQQLLDLQDSPAARALIADLCAWAHALMTEGAPLVHQLPGRAGWELRLVVQGGLRILHQLEAMHFAALVQRPRLRASDAPALLWRALTMRPGRPQPGPRHPEITP
jgi:hydroxysqualene synthase